MAKLSALDRLIQARIQLQREKPFFSFLTMHLTFHKAEGEMEKAIQTIAVDMNGNVPFNEKFIQGLTDAEVKGVLCHEVMHCALEHLARLRGREPDVFNVSADAIINNILLNDQLALPKGVILPRHGSVSLYGKKVEDLNDKSAEEVYDEVYKHIRKKNNNNRQQMKQFIQDNKQNNKGIDKHLHKPMQGNKGGNKNKQGKGGGNQPSKIPKPGQQPGGSMPIPIDETQKDWKKILIDAATFAKQRGDLPAGMERIIGDILDTSIDWKGLLYRYVTNLIPVDYIWTRPSKRTASLGVYLPSVVKEKIDVVVAVDTSGSISQDELTSFMAEIISIIRTFKNVDMTIIDCDCRVNSAKTYKNATVDDALEFKLKGGGGTSHVPVYKWINENMPAAKLLIAFTDGMTEFPNEKDVNTNTLWVLAGYYRASKEHFPFGEVIELPKVKQ